MRIMRRLISERKGLFAGNLAIRLIKDLLPFQGPILVGMAVDLLSGASGRDRNLLGIDLFQNNVRSIVIVAIFMGLLAVAKTVIGYVHTIVAAHMGRHVVQAARRDLANAAMQMSLDERRRFNSGDLLDRCLADSKGLRSFTQNVIIRIISNTVRAIYPLTFMFMVDPILSIVVLIVIPVQSGFSAILQRRLQRQTRDARSSEATHTSVVKEAIDGWNNVASVGGQDWAAQGIHETAAASEDAKIVKKQTTAMISAVISLCTAIGIAAVYAIGGWRIISSGVLDGTGDVANGALTLGTLTAFVGIAKKVYAPFQAYTKIVSSYRTGLVNLERIADVLDAPTIDPRHDGPKLKLKQGTVTLADVGFTYGGAETPTLNAISGSIPGRSLTVITGSSGAGKTTLLRLLLGLDVPTTGTISIDDQDINVANFASLQQAIALVPQEPVLFTGTMKENLLLGREDTSTEQLLNACAQAGLMDMVHDLPLGLDTKVGSGRHMLSGGQLRRTAIARALLRKPAILLLDEPTTGLDLENSTLVLNTLREISGQTTVIMVSHRSEPMKASDHHLILSDGGWSESIKHVHLAAEPSPEAIAAVARAGHSAATNGAALTNDDALTNGAAPSNGAVPSNGSAASHDNAVSNGAGSTNGAGSSNGAGSTNGAQPVSASNGHLAMDQKVMALSAMGRPITLNAVINPEASERVMVITGHRAMTRPVRGFTPALFAQISADSEAKVALATIEDVNPDGAFNSRRLTALGVDLETDHSERLAVETLALQRSLDWWGTDLLIDVAERTEDGDPTVDVEVAVRFRPEADGTPPESAKQLARSIRDRLDVSSSSYKVSLAACLPNSLTDTHGRPVVELSVNRQQEGKRSHALIEAVVASYRSSASMSAQASA